MELNDVPAMVGQKVNKDVKELRIVLFALTGIGNDILQGLASMECAPILLVTRRESGSFPHYQLPNIATIAEKMNIPVLYGEEGEKEVLKLQPDIIIVGTYHRIISAQLISHTKYAFNLHASILPKYRGPCPYYWVLENGEHETGVTAHYITAKLDEGDIVLQKRIPILSEETQGSLRKKLAALSAEIATELLNKIAKGDLLAVKQDEALATYYSWIPENRKYINITTDPKKAMQQIRALTPWPGAILEGDIKVKSIQKVSACLSMPTPDPANQIIVNAGGSSYLLDVAQSYKEHNK